jgi:hypothetical protein
VRGVEEVERDREEGPWDKEGGWSGLRRRSARNRKESGSKMRCVSGRPDRWSGRMVIHQEARLTLCAPRLAPKRVHHPLPTATPIPRRVRHPHSSHPRDDRQRWDRHASQIGHLAQHLEFELLDVLGHQPDQSFRVDNLFCLHLGELVELERDLWQGGGLLWVRRPERQGGPDVFEDRGGSVVEAKGQL